MNCNHCQTRNPIGSRFCRQCGTELAIPAGTLAEEEARRIEAERAREQAAELLARAHRHLERGETDDAIPLAEEAARLLPDSTAAHALRATLYEQARRTDEAIAAMERVVALNPDSAVDRDKLERMRRGVHFVPRIEPVADEDERPARRWIPWVSAGAVGVLALFLGIRFAGDTDPRPTPASPRPQSAAAPTPGPAFTPAHPAGAAPLPTPAPRMPLNIATDPGRSDPFIPVAPGTGAPAPTPNPGGGAGAATPRIPTPQAGSALPPLGGVQPVPPVVVPAPAPPAGNPRETITAGPPPTPATAPAPSPSDGGYIRIQVNPPKGGAGSGAPAERGGPNAESGDPMLRAQTLQLSGRYREAIAFYRNAMAAGADAGECHQGIALCHQRMGEADAARDAYRRAIVAYERQRNTTRWRTAEKGLTACRAALEVLGE